MSKNISQNENNSEQPLEVEAIANIEAPKKPPEEMKYWRSVENRKRTEAYVESVKSEFQGGDSVVSGVQRREMLKLMGASIALSGLGSACRRPVDNILPYSKAPEEVIPGIPNYFATARPSVTGATGLLVQSHEGRPTKVEGNKEHPSSLGAASTYDQASVLELYDPDRSRVPMQKTPRGNAAVTWSDWDDFADKHFKKLKSEKGQGFTFLLNGESSPTVERLKKEVRKAYPLVKFYNYNLLALNNTDLGAELCFGVRARVKPRLEKARVVFTLQADPFMMGADAVVNSRSFSQNRKIYSTKAAKRMNRLYAVEANFSVTGTSADHRLRVSAVESADFLKALAAELSKYTKLDWPSGLRSSFRAFKAKQKYDPDFIRVLAKDLAQNKGRALLIVGENQPAEVHALSHLINSLLGGKSKTFDVIYAEKSAEDMGQDTLAQLVKSLNRGQVKTLVMANVNPVYAASGALKFKDALSKAGTVVHLGLYEDETAKESTWHLPMAHYLESWSDTRAYDGVASVVQPLIAPLHDGRSLVELLAQAVQPGKPNAYEVVKKTWTGSSASLFGEKKWRRVLHDGLIRGTGYKERVKQVPVKTAEVLSKLNKLKWRGAPSKDNLEVLFVPDYSVLDGSTANLSWLQELPDPITKLTWDNALLVSQKTAQLYNLNSRVHKRYYKADRVELSVNKVTLDLPVFIVPGLADMTVIAVLGYGRKNAGYIGNKVGVDVYPALPSDGSWFSLGAKLKRLPETYALATTQEQFAMNGDAIKELSALTLHKRDPARVNTAEDYEQHPDYVKQLGLPKSMMKKQKGTKKEVPVQMGEAWPYKGNKWGMVIDLTSCTGCNACVTACQSENNIPVVGKTQVMRSRAMHWIRIDRYFTGDVKSPKSISQPVPCMHCENAPCEPVCPVAATVHDTEGLNAMAYNRCVGTRYCGNNCPYKVRRFNFLDYSHSGDMYVEPVNKERNVLLQMQKNPNVTIRYRGVMEKCTYCTQRIQEAKIAAIRNKQDVNSLPDGAVTPACAQTCPTGAITFGNLNDKNSRVAKLKQVNRNYDLLEELNVRPRTSYLGKLRNPNPELV